MLLDPDKVIDFFCTCPERQVVFYFLYLAWLHYVYERTDIIRLFSQSFPITLSHQSFVSNGAAKVMLFLFPATFCEKIFNYFFVAIFFVVNAKLTPLFLALLIDYMNFPASPLAPCIQRCC